MARIIPILFLVSCTATPSPETPPAPINKPMAEPVVTPAPQVTKSYATEQNPWGEQRKDTAPASSVTYQKTDDSAPKGQVKVTREIVDRYCTFRMVNVPGRSTARVTGTREVTVEPEQATEVTCKPNTPPDVEREAQLIARPEARGRKARLISDELKYLKQ